MELVNVYAERRQVYLTFDIKLWSLFSLLKFPQSDSEPKTGLWDVFWYSKLRKTQLDLFLYPYDRKWKKRSSLSRFHCGKKRGSPIPTWYVKSNWLIRGTSNSIDYVTPHYYKRAAAFYYTKMGFGTPSAITRNNNNSERAVEFVTTSKARFTRI